MAASARSGTHKRIYAAVRKIPKGRVATYGQIARVAGFPRHARLVGYALNALNESKREHRSVPWQRVINARGEVSLRAYPGADELQRRLLEDEGIEFDVRGRVSLARFQWKRERNPGV